MNPIRDHTPAPQRLRPLTRDEVRDVDRRALDEFGMSGLVLMENAGRGAAELLLRIGIAAPVTICAGPGNNGGDGFVMARHLENAGVEVRVLLFAPAERFEGDATVNLHILRAAGTPLLDWGGSQSDVAKSALSSSAWIVDALLGTGMRGAVREPLATAIEEINRAGPPILAIDLPSGLDCDTGRPLGACIRAAATATFVSTKIGFAAPGAEQFTGEVHVIDIGVPRAMLAPFNA